LHTESFPQKAVAAAAQVDLVDLVVAGLHQHGHIQLRTLDRLDHSDFVAKVRQQDDETVDVVAVLVEQLHILAHVFGRFDRAIVRLTDRQDVVADAELVELGDDVAARVERQRAIEELAAADDQAERDFLVEHIHFIFPFLQDQSDSL
jgi:DNA-binding MarR family transcriptional regulator